jgi:predicted acyl esterase
MTINDFELIRQLNFRRGDRAESRFFYHCKDGRVDVKHHFFAARSSELIGIINMRSIAIERDLPVPIRDGVLLFANLFRPAAEGSYPVLMSVTPYGKDKLPDRLTTFFMRLSGVRFGKLNCSRLTGFEAPDPIYWVQQG